MLILRSLFPFARFVSDWSGSVGQAHRVPDTGRSGQSLAVQAVQGFLQGLPHQWRERSTRPSLQVPDQ
jgi:hypothetical protein